MHTLTGEECEKAKQIAGVKHILGRGKRKAQNFSGVSMRGVVTELQRGQCGPEQREEGEGSRR